MWYMVHGTDIADSLGRRLAARPAHLERLKQLQNQGRLLLAGPLPAVDSNDPGPAGFQRQPDRRRVRFAGNGARMGRRRSLRRRRGIARVEVKPFRKVFP